MPSMSNIFAKNLGFKNVKELEKLVSCLDLTDQKTWSAFLKWAQEDSTKAGLVKLIEEHNPKINGTLEKGGIYV